MVREALKWFDLYLKCSSDQRKKIRKSVIRAVENYSDKGEGNSDTKAGKKLSKSLKEDFTFVGISPNIMYAKESGSAKDLKATWVHPWATPTLAFKHKKLPAIILVNPGIRYNESFLQEMAFNIKHLENLYEMAGISG